jgi:hypothetical protein
MLCGETGFLKTIDVANAASDFSVSDPALQIFLALAAVFRLILFRIRREGVASAAAGLLRKPRHRPYRYRPV